MKLTPEQIEQLYSFTRQHYVEWYDVHSELVDHLANAIETEWELNPNRTFEEVLQTEFKKFGIFGFMDVVEEKSNMLSKRYEKMIWNYYKEFFKLPKIILTLSSIYLIYFFTSRWEYGGIFIISAFVIIYFWGCTEAFIQSRKLKKKLKTTGKKWLFENMIDNNLFFMFYILSPFNLYNGLKYLGYEKWNDLYFMTSAAILVVIALYVYVRMKTIPPLVNAELSKLYPEYI